MCVCVCTVCVKVLSFLVCRCTNTHALVLNSHPRSTPVFRDVYFAKVQLCMSALWNNVWKYWVTVE